MKQIYYFLRILRESSKMFGWRSLLPYVGVAALVLVALTKAQAQEIRQPNYVFSGLYQVSEILPAYCENCYLGLPVEYLETSLVLAVKTDNKDDLFQAIKNASRANGWALSRKGKTIKAERIEDKGVAFLSKIDTSVKRVATDEIVLHRLADSLKAVSMNLAKFHQDSLASIPPLGFQNYKLIYVAYSKSFAEKLGVSWREILAQGDLRSVPKFYDNWQLYATENNDTTFNRQDLAFSLDSSMSLSWGAEKQVALKAFTADGIIEREYEWRKYGLEVQINRDERRVKMAYTFRNDDGTETTLTGSAVGTKSDTLKLVGNYRTTQTEKTGVPFLAKIPILGYLFSTESTNTDYKRFELYLIPQIPQGANQ